MTDPAPQAPWLHRPSLTAYGAMPDLDALRGDRLLRAKDVEAARRYYELSAAAGSAHGAVGLGSTYDPAIISALQANSVKTDALIASIWYKRAQLMDTYQANLRLQDISLPASN